MDDFLFVLSKISAPFFSPLFLLLVGVAVLGVLLWRSRAPRRLACWCLILSGAGMVLGSPLLSGALVRLWEVPPAEVLPGEPAQVWDLALVLGGGVDPRMSRGWQISSNQAAERVESAARLWHEGRVRAILVSGGSGDIHNQELREGPAMRRLLVGLGVPEDRVLVDSESRNTHENARESLKLLQATGFVGGEPQILLITSALHMRRSEAIFQKAFAGGARLSALSVDSQALPITFPECLIADAQSLDLSGKVIREAAGYLAYAVLGRL